MTLPDFHSIPEDTVSESQPDAPFGLEADAFKAAFRNHPAGVAVITADPGTGPVGLTATSVFSVSADPALLVFSLSAISSSTPGIVASDTVVVHLLDSSQQAIAQRFATSGIDRFADASSWNRLPTGEPYLTGASVWIRGRIVDRMHAGGSTVVAVHALEAHVDEAEHAAPLVYHNRTWHQLSEHSKLDV